MHNFRVMVLCLVLVGCSNGLTHRTSPGSLPLFSLVQLDFLIFNLFQANSMDPADLVKVEKLFLRIVTHVGSTADII